MEMYKSFLKGMFIGFFLVSLGLSLSSFYKIISTSAPDFQVLWLSSKDLLAGNNPYLNPGIFTGVGYPANTLLFYLPLTLLPLRTAQGIFIGLSFVSFFATIYLCFKIVASKVNWIYFIVASTIGLWAFPLKFTLGMGQNNLLAFLALLVSLYFSKKAPAIAGIFLGIAVSFKTVFGFLLLFFFLKRKWKLLCFSVLTVLVFVFITVALSGINLYGYYVQKVVPPLLNYAGREVYFNQGFMGFISRITPDIQLRTMVNNILSVLVLAVISAFSLIRKNYLLTFSLFIISLVLLDTLSWQHHFVWLIFPFILIGQALVKLRLKGLFLPFILSLFFVSWNFKNPSLYSSFPVNLMLSNTFYGGFILWVVNIYLLFFEEKLHLDLDGDACGEIEIG
jgi:hypothetical protein